MSDGGEGQSGWIMPKEVKLKKSIAMTGKKLGPLSEETKRKISKSKMGKNTGQKHHNYGKKMSEESKKKMSIKAKERIGEKNNMFGKKHTEESKIKMSKNTKKLFGKDNPVYGRNHTEKEKTFDTWKLINIDGKEMIIDNLSKFCRENDLNQTCMRDIYYGRMKNHKGWVSVGKLTNNVKKKKD